MADEVEEPEVREWADEYIAKQREIMDAEERTTGRRRRALRAQVRADVEAKFGEGNGGIGTILTIFRILYWVAIIMAAL